MNVVLFNQIVFFLLKSDRISSLSSSVNLQVAQEVKAIAKHPTLVHLPEP
ncbi:MAG TPA: hypothetical protein V6D43_15490 [Candidatus Sericytochromatia bacterium]